MTSTELIKLRMPTHGLISLVLGLSTCQAFRLGSVPRRGGGVRMSIIDVSSVAALPDGVEKEVLRSPLPAAKQAYDGAIVTVHFSMSLDNGTLLHDSRKGEPLEFTMGVQPSEAVLGWDLALREMRIGELVRLRCAPEYAYGARGAPPLVPPDATLVFELELLRMRDLASSNVTDAAETDLVKRYRAMLANEELTRRVEQRHMGEQGQGGGGGGGGGGDDDDDVELEIPKRSVTQATPAAPPAASAPAEPEGEQVKLSMEAAAAAAATWPSATDGNPIGAAPLRTDPFGGGVPPQPTAASAVAPAAAPSTAPPPSSSPSPPPPVAMRGWVPERTRIEGQHVNGYSWREDDDEMEVRVPLPAGTRKGAVRCEIGPATLLLAVGEQPPLLCGQLVGGVWVDGSAWSFESEEEEADPEGGGEGPTLTILLAKRPPHNQLWGYVMMEDRVNNYEEPPEGRRFGEEQRPGETKAW